MNFLFIRNIYQRTLLTVWNTKIVISFIDTSAQKIAPPEDGALNLHI